MSRDPEHLHPLLVPLWLRFMRDCRTAGLNPRLAFTYRSPAEQDALYAKGRTAPGKIVTHAKGGQSWHNVTRALGVPASLAFDVAQLTDDGRSLLSDNDLGWVIAGELGEVIGLTWGGRWKMRDLMHFQLDDHGKLSLADAMAGKDPVS